MPLLKDTKNFIRILPPVGGWNHHRYMHWVLPPQAQPDPQGNYVPAARVPAPGGPVTYGPGLGNSALAKALAQVGPARASSLRIPEPGDKIKHRTVGYTAIITDVIYNCTDKSSEPYNDLPGVPKVRVLIRNESGSYLLEDYVWSSLDHFHGAMEVLSTGHRYAPQLLYKAAPAKIDLSAYPHTCKLCGSPSYNGFTSVECSNGSCSANRGFVR